MMFLLGYIAAPPTMGSAAKAVPASANETIAVAVDSLILRIFFELHRVTGVGLSSASVTPKNPIRPMRRSGSFQIRMGRAPSFVNHTLLRSMKSKNRTDLGTILAIAGCRGKYELPRLIYTSVL